MDSADTQFGVGVLPGLVIDPTLVGAARAGKGDGNRVLQAKNRTG